MEKEKEELDTIKAITEEYEKKIEELQKQHLEEIENVRKEETEKRLNEIRSLISGRKIEPHQKEETDEQDLSFYDKTIQEVRKKLKLTKEVN